MDQEEKLKQEILADAQSKAEKIVAHAKNEAEQLIADARQEALKAREARLAEAKEEAEKRCRMVFNGVDLEIHRRWLKKQEECIDELLKAATEQVQKCTGAERGESLKSLVLEAMKSIGNRDCVVSFNPEDAGTVSEAWLAELAKSVYDGETPKYTLKADLKPGGGIILETLDGARQFDNSYQTRMARMKDDLRILVLDQRKNK